MDDALYTGQKDLSGARLVSPPFFSVIIATYNRAGLITRALNSLISQTEKEWEAIIVDDGSNDDTCNVILPFLRSGLEILYVKQPHRGMSFAKNTGMYKTKGHFITFLDSDDEFNPVHLESRKAILKQNPEVRFLYGGAKILGSQYVRDRFNPGKLISLDKCVVGGTFVIERNTALALKGFRNLLFGSDADLFDRAIVMNVRMMEVTESTYIYHHETEDSITNRL